MGELFYNRSWLNFIDEKKNILREVIKFDSKNKSLKIDSTENQLRKFLNTLELEDVMFVQTVMYVGRDEDHDAQKTPEAIFKSKRKAIGGENKTAEVSQIVTKSRVTEYLLNGMSILKI